jgi:hypothetical protein
LATKKKENELTYLQMPLPTEAKSKKTVRLNWSGINKTQTLDTGELSYEQNISTYEAPYLTPSWKRDKVVLKKKNGTIITPSGYPVGLFGFDNFLLALYQSGNTVTVYYITEDDVISGTYQAASYYDGNIKRCVVMMPLFPAGSDITTDTFVKKILIFPDKKSMDFRPSGTTLSIANIPAPGNPIPNIRYATVHLSRLYGVGCGDTITDPDRIFVSGFNDYSNWRLDTSEEYNQSNAWVSLAQSNVKATGAFTGITTYLNSVVAFKRDYIHEVTGNSNPFKINDVYAEGATDNRNIVDVDGNLIFTSDDAVKVYTGGNPRILSYKLNVRQFNNAVAGTDGRRYYLYCEDENEDMHLFVYDTVIMQWAEEDIDEQVISFAKNSDGFYMLTGEGNIYRYRIDSDAYAGQPWSAETDLTAGHTIDIKHIQKIQILADVAAGSTIRAHLIYYGENTSIDTQQIYNYTNQSAGTKRAAIRVVPRNTAHWGVKLRLSGTGFSRVYQAEITLKGGGTLYGGEYNV